MLNESAILIKDQIFRGRLDVNAWFVKQFLEEVAKVFKEGVSQHPATYLT